MSKFVISLAVTLGLAGPVIADGVPVTVPAFVHDAGPSAIAPAPSAALPNPATSPVAAWDETKAARKTSWPLAVFAALVMLGKALAYGREKLKGVPVIGKGAAWLSVGKRAVLVAGLGTVGAAGYDVLIGGGSLVAALTGAGVALAGVMHSTTKGAPPPIPVA